MKVTITRVTTEAEEADLPGTCPACMVDFSVPGNLTEYGRLRSESAVYLDEDAQQVFEDEDEDFPDTDPAANVKVTGYGCRACGQLLIGHR